MAKEDNAEELRKKAKAFEEGELRRRAAEAEEHRRRHAQLEEQRKRDQAKGTNSGGPRRQK